MLSFVRIKLSFYVEGQLYLVEIRFWENKYCLIEEAAVIWFSFMVLGIKSRAVFMLDKLAAAACSMLCTCRN